MNPEKKVVLVTIGIMSVYYFRNYFMNLFYCTKSYFQKHFNFWKK